MTITGEDLRVIGNIVTAIVAAVGTYMANRARVISKDNNEKLVEIGVKVDGRLDKALAEIESLKRLLEQESLPKPRKGRNA